MPDEVKEAALEQVEKLEAFGSESQESAVTQNYLDLLLQLPWKPECTGTLILRKPENPR